MKKIYKILIAIYVVIAIFTTISLFTYNKYKVSQIGNKVFIKLDKQIENYNKGNLLIINAKKDYVSGDNIFYCNLKDNKCDVNYGRISTVMGGNPTVDGEEISKKLILGTDEKIKAIPLLGSIMGTLESRWVYLILIVLPILVAFIYEGYSIAKELKKKK